MWLLGAASPGLGASAPDLGRPFEPKPVSRPLYGVAPPSTNPQRQQHFLEARDGTRLYVETWLPAPKNGHKPPKRLPTILVMSPYLSKGEPAYPSSAPLEPYVKRGYAYAQMHMRGTGESGGCLGRLGPNEIDDGARVVEYLGRDAPWADGAVGMFGRSHAGGSQTAVAALGDPKRTRYLKAIVPVAPDLSSYQYSLFDGVPYFLHAPLVRYEDKYLAPGESTQPQDYLDKLFCQPEIKTESLRTDGDFTTFHRKREHRRGVKNIRAAVLSVHGHRDDNTTPITQAGFFDQLPATTPKAGLFGVFGHENPDNHYSGVQPDWERADFTAMVLAWFDRYLKGLPSGVKRWPTVQVQGSDGQWRVEPDWPSTGGPAAQLALGPAGSLGVKRPEGKSSYSEGFFESTTEGVRLTGTAAVFETKPLPERLELTGSAVLDMWVSLDKPDAHLAARLQAIDASGVPIEHADVVGFRSMRHLEPLRRGVFVQTQGRPAPTGRPVRVSLRFHPADIVVPEGGHLRLTLAGSQPAKAGLEALIEETTGLMFPSFYELPSWPSGAGTHVTILHDCRHPSVLRFALPRRKPRLLNVREKDEPSKDPLADNRPFPSPVSDGGGIATASVCGRAPVDPHRH